MVGPGQTDNQDLVRLALHDPARAIDAATTLVENPSSAEAKIIALRARGLARRVLGDFVASELDLTAAMEQADDLNDDELWAGAGLSLAGTRVFQGRIGEAKQLLRQCIARATGESHVEAICQLGTTCAQAGEFDQAMRHYDRALPMIQELERKDWEADLLGNRGAIHTYLGNYDQAIHDLDSALEMIADHGPSLYSLHRGNKAYALHLRGDIAEAIDLYEENERFQKANGLPTLMYSQRCVAYLAAGMFEEAMSLAKEAHQFHTDGQATLGSLEALLAGADAALALGDATLTDQLASAAIEIDADNSFPTFTARARLALIENRAKAGVASFNDVERAVEQFEIVERANSAVAARALLIGAAVAQEHGRQAEVERLINRAVELGDVVPVHVQLELLHVRAVQARSDDEEVLDLVERGLRLFRQQIRGVHSYDVRYKAARHAEALTTKGIEILINRGELRSAGVLIDQQRSTALHAGGSSEDLGPHQDVTARFATGSYLIFVEHEDQVLCIDQSSAGTLLHTCGSLAEVTQVLGEHRFAHRQLARRQRLRDTTRRQLVSDAEEADRALAQLLLPANLEDRVIVNPCGLLDGLLWGALSPLESRAFSLAPSLAIATRPIPTQISEVAVLGASELPHVPDELHLIATCWGGEARVDPDPTVVEGLADVDLLHIAGHFIADGRDPLFSALPLGDFRFRGYDYLRIQPPPKIAIVSACSSGRADTIAGAHVGFASAALAAGTSAVVVAQAPIEDGPAIVGVMDALHAALRAGQSPAEALRTIRVAGDVDDRSILSSLVVLGAGW